MPQSTLRSIAAVIAGLIVVVALSTVADFLGLVAIWNRGPEFGPKWYPLVLVLLAIPSAWIGGAVYERRSAHRS